MSGDIWAVLPASERGTNRGSGIKKILPAAMPCTFAGGDGVLCILDFSGSEQLPGSAVVLFWFAKFPRCVPVFQG